MKNIVLQLEVDRVDLVGEGCNTASFIKLTKRRENNNMDFNQILGQLTPDQQAVVKSHVAGLEAKVTEAGTTATALAKAKTDLDTANATITTLNSDLAIAKAKKEETEPEETDPEKLMKSLPAGMQVIFGDIIAKQKAAETFAATLIEKQKTDEANVLIAKMKSIPVDMGELFTVVKSADEATRTILVKAAEAIEAGLLSPVGKSSPTATFSGKDAWGQIEKSAKEYQAADSKLTKDSAIAKAIAENPELYDAYMKEVRS